MTSVMVQQQRGVVHEHSPDLVMEAEDVRISYVSDGVSHDAVLGATFAIRRGEKVAVVGESGSGKTTLARALAGLLTAPNAVVRADRLEFEGRALDRGRPRKVPLRTPGIAMVFQDAMTSLDPVSTIASQFSAVLRARARVSRRDAMRQAQEWLARVGLHDAERILRARAYELSGGMRQRVMVALAMCGEPSLLIADEPTSALDASVSREVMDMLTDITAERGVSLLIVSHDIDLCREYADRMIVMYQGAIVDVCSAATISQEATHPYTRALLQCVPTLAAAQLDRLPTLASVGDGPPTAASAGATAAERVATT